MPIITKLENLVIEYVDDLISSMLKNIIFPQMVSGQADIQINGEMECCASYSNLLGVNERVKYGKSR